VLCCCESHNLKWLKIKTRALKCMLVWGWLFGWLQVDFGLGLFLNIVLNLYTNTNIVLN
jgi:hypothetical protein